MKRALILSAAVVLCASPSFALKVTNLDSMPHRVVFTAAGRDHVQEIAPDATEYFLGQPSGMLSLADGQPKPSRGTLHADGILSGVIGAERTENIPADTDDVFVIWPGGHMSVQQHQYGHYRNF